MAGHPNRRPPWERTDVWREGRYADLWSVVHVLSGSHFGFVPLFIATAFVPLAIITAVLLIAWEVFEKQVLGVTEYPENQTTDVLFGMAGFVAAYALVINAPTVVALQVGVATALINLGMSVWGWRVSVRAETVAQKLKEDFARERERIESMRSELGEEFRDIRLLRDDWRNRRKMRREQRRNR